MGQARGGDVYSPFLYFTLWVAPPQTRACLLLFKCIRPLTHMPKEDIRLKIRNHLFNDVGLINACQNWLSWDEIILKWLNNVTNSNISKLNCFFKWSMVLLVLPPIITVVAPASEDLRYRILSSIMSPTCLSWCVSNSVLV